VTTLVLASNLGGGISRHLGLVATSVPIDVHELSEDTSLLAKVRSARQLMRSSGPLPSRVVTHGVAAAVAARHRGRRLRTVEHVEHWHGDPFFLAPRRRLAYTTLARSGKAPALQVFTHEWLLPLYHDRRCRFEILPNTVPVQDVSAAPTTGTSRTAVFLGRLSPEKGVADLLAAWPPDSEARGWALDLWGSGPLGEVPAPPGVTFRGAPTDPMAVLARADLVVIPSWTETGPYTACEAMALGRPFVGTATGDMPAFLTSGCGWSAPPRQPSGLRAALVEAQGASSDQLADKGAAGRSWLAQNRPFEAWTRAVREIYGQ